MYFFHCRPNAVHISHSNQITNVDTTSFVLRVKNNLKMRQKQTTHHCDAPVFENRSSSRTNNAFVIFYISTTQLTLTYRKQKQPTASCVMISLQKHVSCARASQIHQTVQIAVA